MPIQHSRLQLATKIHFFLLRELGKGIDVERMLRGNSYARDVLLVCEACRGSELAVLARQFRAASAPQSSAPVSPGGGAASAAPGHARQPLDWSVDTSGFGTGDPNAEPARSASRLKSSWLRRLTRR